MQVGPASRLTLVGLAVTGLGVAVFFADLIAKFNGWEGMSWIPPAAFCLTAVGAFFTGKGQRSGRDKQD